MQAAAALEPATGAGTAVRTVLVGDDALGPIAWVAPEVLAGSLTAGVTATPASDVYMLGGLMFEVLTCGLAPYYWLMPALIAQVRGMAGHVCRHHCSDRRRHRRQVDITGRGQWTGAL